MTHTDSVEAIICDGLFTGKIGKIVGFGSSIHSIRLLVDETERYEPDYALLPITTENKKALELLLSHLTTLQATQSQQVEEAVKDIIKMADALELECSKDGDKGTKQWMAFKGFRNTIRDKYLTPNHQD